MAQDTATRLAQVREIAAQIEARCAGESRLVMGDLNAAPDSDEIRWLLKHAGLVDTFAAIHPADPGFTWHARNRFTSEQQPNLPDRRIDYILAAGEEIVGALRSCRIVCDVCTETGIFPSDHYGVMAEFVLENP
jgi:endonuclease/exonuclease/phosphatase family metal-dependent hydrolase